MDYSQWVSLIGSVGFPIACCLIMIVTFYKLYTKQSEDHKAEMDSLRQALDNNTKALESLKEEILKNE